MQELTKKQYVTPNLKQHGVVRELTQTGSGGPPSKEHEHEHRHKEKYRRKKWKKRR